MLILGPLVFLLFALLAVSLAYGAVRFVRHLELPNETCDLSSPPKVLLIQCLKGTDPFLLDALQRLATQDYPNYSIRIIVDSPDDPAWEAVNEFLASGAAVPVEVRTLEHVLLTCSRKISSQLEVTKDIPEDVKYVMLADADMNGPPDVLRRMVVPLELHPDILITTGNRWYNPLRPDLAEVIRYQWNSFCVTMMHRIGSMWGGCCVMRASLWRDPKYREDLSHSFCEDQRLMDTAPQFGGTIYPVPGLLITNRESCTLRQVFNFIERQLMAVRIQSSQWNFVQLHFYGGAVVALLSLYGLFIPEMWGWIGGGLVLLVGVAVWRLPYIEQRIQRRLGPTAAPPQLPSFWRRYVPTVVLTGAMHGAATVSNIVMRVHEWRGVRYEVRKGPYIRVLNPETGETEIESSKVTVEA
ncbi:MAG: glycosyltransferase family 2 protein [Planctomycetaceae bacterium]|nr:glycosyltransferase family 2 protein [Planctomycetaceae bacterium]